MRLDRSGRLALYALGALLAVALAAPLFASAQPLLWRAEGGALSSPWLWALFDENVHPSALDRAYNALLLLALPVVLLVRRGRWRAGIAVAVAGMLFATAAPLSRPRAVFSSETSTFSLRTPIAVGPHEVDLDAVRAGPSATHPLGTDAAGRDVMARLMWGARPSLTVGVLSVALYIALGALLGALAGWYGGRTDLLIQRAIEVMMSIPSLFLVLAASAFIEHRSIFHLLIIIAAVGWTTPARLVRAEFLRLRGLEFVLAARASGASERTIMWREIFPNAVGPLWVTATFGVGSAILIESTMSFLGLGDPSLPSWGQILSAGRATREWRLIIAPGVAIFLTVGLVNLLGESARRALDVRR